MRALLLYLVRLYQATPRPRTCRFTPSCSEYAYQAISEYGIIAGTLRSLKRFSRCHPLHPGGYDPVH